ncbi:hypothetical protein CDL12_00175 [Handroanthus impetiginosus]|uniref:Uncharacterized protein n=1 Tax=Handroanthus impetiginosus TaxID=429701 RepID=A0A2G9IBD6_9LAMI|nr:hypothetical protein CDL12_00175 [Handroanthus impetiginosus]
MYGYGRIKSLRLIEPSSDFLSYKTKSQTQTQTHDYDPPYSEIFQNEKDDDQKSSSSFSLRRNLTISSSSPSSALKRAFSMRRSSSVSEKYCRIHDSPPLDDQGFIEPAGVIDKNKEDRKSHRFKIFKSCKRIFGL